MAHTSCHGFQEGVALKAMFTAAAWDLLTMVQAYCVPQRESGIHEEILTHGAFFSLLTASSGFLAL